MIVKEMANKKKGYVSESKIIVPCKILKTNTALHVNLFSNAARLRNKDGHEAGQAKRYLQGLYRRIPHKIRHTRK